MKSELLSNWNEKVLADVVLTDRAEEHGSEEVGSDSAEDSGVVMVVLVTLEMIVNDI